MIDHPLVSIVMPVYNAERFLKPAIDSILDQTFSDFEFIIIDDGSTDDSMKIIKAYDDPRIRVISNPKNLGLVETLNLGIAQAKGKFIARMDADDVSHPERLKKQIALLESDPTLAVVGSAFNLIDEQGEVVRSFTYPSRDIDIKRHLFIGNPLAHGSIVMLKSAVEEAGGYRSVGPVEDYELWIRLFEVDCKFAAVPEVLFDWRQTPGGVSVPATQTQGRLAHELRDKLWAARPLPSASIGELLAGLHYYQNLNSPLADQYASDQLSLAWLALRHGRLMTVLKIKLAFVLMFPANLKAIGQSSAGMIRDTRGRLGQLKRRLMRG